MKSRREWNLERVIKIGKEARYLQNPTKEILSGNLQWRILLKN